MKRLLIIIDKAPNVGHRCGTIVGEGLRAAVGLAGMDIDTTVALVNDAVFTVLGEQSPLGTGMKDLDQFMKDAEEFGLKVQVHLESARKRGITDDQLAGFETLNTERLTQLVHEVDAITF
jgi:sulfur relay (sulfurtransferase) DsrF/TusC family protein